MNVSDPCSIAWSVTTRSIAKRVEFGGLSTPNHEFVPGFLGFLMPPRYRAFDGRQGTAHRGAPWTEAATQGGADGARVPGAPTSRPSSHRLLCRSCQRSPYSEPPGSGKLSHPGSPILSQAGSPMLSHPGAGIVSHPVGKWPDSLVLSIRPALTASERSRSSRRRAHGGTEESGDRDSRDPATAAIGRASAAHRARPRRQPQHRGALPTLGRDPMGCWRGR
jgi:hypothetical protein